jgi:exodeoxyribonuclease III
LQEHKLQEKNAEVKLRMEELFPDYQSFWVFSTVKKGYSGVAVFIKHSGIDLTQLTSTDKQRSITNYAQKNTSPNTSGEHFFLLNKESMPHESFRVISISYPTIQGAQAEGRVVLVELKSCYLFLVYVPNSGVRLERLSYRVEQWDTQLLALLKKYEKRKPVALIGDLNVAHCDIDIYNPTAKHIAKTAGCTREERESFGRLLDNGFVDSFRFFYPESKGHYTYWSQRANNRPYNRGLRLDYSVGSCALFNYDEQEAAGVFIYDSQILSSEGTSVGDHCPILLTLGSKK